MPSSSLALRSGLVDSQATLIRAALLAAHSVHARDGGFRAVDLRFYFRLFSNWLEQDVLRPSQDLQLTQVRRVFQGLIKQGLARSRARRLLISELGLLELAERLVDEVGVAFEENLFVLLFAISYRGVLTSRVLGAAPALSPEARRRLGNLLDARRVGRLAVRRAERLVKDLHSRLELDRALETQLQGLQDDAAVPREQWVARLPGVGAYGLERVRPLRALLAQLPPDLLHEELARGIPSRRQLLFLPLLARAREELRQLQKIVAAL